MEGVRKSRAVQCLDGAAARAASTEEPSPLGVGVSSGAIDVGRSSRWSSAAGETAAISCRAYGGGRRPTRRVAGEPVAGEARQP